MTAESVFIPHDHILDPKIEYMVRTFQEAGIETYESCQGGVGHAFHHPTIRFSGVYGDGWKAVQVALVHGFRIRQLNRFWTCIENEMTGPEWEIVFCEPNIPDS